MSNQNRALSTQKIEDVNIAAAMFSLGFEQERTAIQIKKRNGRIQFIYFFKPKSTCGRYTLKECLAAWTCDDFIAENPFHELTAMRVFSENRFQMLGEIKAQQGMLTEVSEDGVDGLINLASKKEELEKLFS